MKQKHGLPMRKLIPLVLLAALLLMTACEGTLGIDESGGAVATVPPEGPTQIPAATLAPIISAPPDGQQTPVPIDSAAAQAALDKLMTYTKEQLDLPQALTDYTWAIDPVVATVNEKECYVISAMEIIDDVEESAGAFYYALDGTALYRFDALTGEMIEVKG